MTGIDRIGRRKMRWPVGQHERDARTGVDREFADRRQIHAVQRHRRMQHDHVGPGNRAQRRR